MRPRSFFAPPRLLSPTPTTGSSPSLDLLQSLPASDGGWLWEYDEDNPASLLWVARQPAFRNDDMMGYHFYRNFEALMTGAAAISPDTPGLTPR